MKDPYNLKEQLKEYFHFSKSEQRGILMLLVLIGFFFMMPKIYKAFFFKERVVDFSEFEADIEAFEAGKAEFRDSMAGLKTNNQPANSPFPARDKKEIIPLAKPFKFNPNTAGYEDLCKLGIKAKTAHTIINYREKGGQFRVPDDLKKIYGFTESDYQRLKSFIVIPAKENQYEKSKKDHQHSEELEEKKKAFNPKSVEKEVWTKKKKEPILIRINQATAEEWQRLYGIGPAYAKRIVKFREALGGFYSVDQISEVYGMPDSTFQAIKPSLVIEKPLSNQVNINTADAETLKSHPYLSWKQANAISNYRKNHGPFESVESIKVVGAIDEKTYSKISPYLFVDGKKSTE